MRKTIAVLLLAAVSLSGLSGCGKDKAAAGTPAITVNGDTIYQETIDARFIQNCAMYQVDPTDESMSYLKDYIAEGLIEEKLLLQEAQRRGMEASQEEIDAVMAPAINQYGSEKDLEEKYLVPLSMTLAEYKQMAEEYILFDELITAESQAKTDAIDAQAYYDEHRESFLVEEQVKAKHILVDTEEEAKEIIAQLDSGADFATLAQEKSTDEGSKGQGGELGYFNRARMVAPFAEAAFSQEVGTYSQTPVQSDFGYHIILVEDHQEAHYQDFEDVREAIVQELTYQIQQEVYAELLGALRADAEIVYLNQQTEDTPSGGNPADAGSASGE